MTDLLNPLTFPLHGTRLIEASAGTGKTYTIAALYLRLILGHDETSGYGRPLIPPEILVVTFTNAATQELRDRIRNRLVQAASFFRDEDDGDDFLQALRATVPAVNRSEKAWTLDQAAQWMDEAAIFTIHGWAQRMLRQHAFDSNSLFDLTLEPNDRELLEEAARDYWRTFLYPLPLPSLKALLGHIHSSTPQDLLKSVRPLFGIPSDASPDPFILLEKTGQNH
jgi:exodeoxyribonuclease V beta subunit